MMAVLWETWQQGKQHRESCVVLTQNANEDCFEVHNRMPVLLDEENLAAWLHNGTLPASPGAGSIVRHPVDRSVNKVSQNHPGLVQPIPRLFDHE